MGEPDSGTATILRRHIARTGLSQYRLAKLTDLHYSTINKAANGQRTLGTAAIGRLSTILGGSFAKEILEHYGERNHQES